MQKIVVIGSGFAGLCSALAARRLIHAHNKDDAIEVLVIAPEPSLVLRPRLYEAGAAELKQPLGELFHAAGIKFLQALVKLIDVEKHSVQTTSNTGDESIISYDRLVLAAGSRLVRPKSIDGLEDHAFDIDQINAAAKLEKHFHELSSLPPSPERDTVVVCGAGFTGIELASELPNRLRAIWGNDANPKSILVDTAKDVGSELGPGPRPVITKALEKLGVEVKLGAAVAKIDAEGVTTAAGEQIKAMTSIWTAGVKATPLTEQIPGEKDSQCRLHVDRDLRVPLASGVFATGDTAHALTGDKAGHVAMMSCQHALVLGRVSGHNAAADLLGLPTKAYSQPGYVTCLDLGGYGAVLTKGWGREVILTGHTAKQVKKHINGVLIYPPKADLKTALSTLCREIGSHSAYTYQEKASYAPNGIQEEHRITLRMLDQVERGR